MALRVSLIVFVTLGACYRWLIDINEVIPLGYKSNSRGSTICRSCQCMRCSCLLCEWEQFYRCYPINAGCLRCMYQENDKPVKDCSNFRPRSVVPVYRVKYKRKDPYYRLARSLHSIVDQIRKL